MHQFTHMYTNFLLASARISLQCASIVSQAECGKSSTTPAHSLWSMFFKVCCKWNVESPVQLPSFFSVQRCILFIALSTVGDSTSSIGPNFKSQDSMHIQWLDARCILRYINNMTCIYTCTYIILPCCVWSTSLAKIASHKSGNDCRVDSVACKERHLSKVEPGRQLAAGAAFRI